VRHRETRTHPPKKPMRVVTSGSPTKTAFHTTAQLEVECLGSSLRIEFLLNQNQGQIGPLCLEKRGDRIQNRAAVASLCDSPASTLPLLAARRGRFATHFAREARCSTLPPASK